MSPPLLLDSHALLTLFQREPGAQDVASLLRKAMDEGVDRLFCIISLWEILCLTKRRFGESKKLEVLGRVYEMGIKTLSASDSMVLRAADVKAEHSISCADCFALACALEHSALLVTGDPEFQEVSHLVNMKWVGKGEAPMRKKKAPHGSR